MKPDYGAEEERRVIARELHDEVGQALTAIKVELALAQHKIQAAGGTRMDQRLQPEAEVTAYRMVQEALTNVVKHAHATSCRVYLQRLANTLLVTVEDDGVGFDQAAGDPSDTNHGLGLIGIRERVARIGGSLRLETAPEVLGG